MAKSKKEVPQLEASAIPSVDALKAHRKVIAEQMVRLVMADMVLNREGRLHSENVKLDSLNRAIWYLENP